MIAWPDLGTRVTVRYRLPAGSVPPLTDAVGHLLAIDPVVRVRTKAGAVAECAPADVVALRVLTDAPVRTDQIRALEYAAALGGPAGPAAEQAWLDGWLLRAGGGPALDANSAVPLDISARPDAIPAIVTWYTQRGLTPRLAIPDRLLRPPPGLDTEYTEKVLVRDVRDVPEGHAGVSPASGRYPQLGARRVGLFDVLRVGEQDTSATDLAHSLGFRLHHRTRYFPVRPGTWDTV